MFLKTVETKAMSINIFVNKVETAAPQTVGEDRSQAVENALNDPTEPPPRIRWYRNDIGPRLKHDTQTLFETYAGISGEELIEHLHSVVSCVSRLFGKWF